MLAWLTISRKFCLIDVICAVTLHFNYLFLHPYLTVNLDRRKGDGPDDDANNGVARGEHFGAKSVFAFLGGNIFRHLKHY